MLTYRKVINNREALTDDINKYQQALMISRREYEDHY